MFVPRTAGEGGGEGVKWEDYPFEIVSGQPHTCVMLSKKPVSSMIFSGGEEKKPALWKPKRCCGNTLHPGGWKRNQQLDRYLPFTWQVGFSPLVNKDHKWGVSVPDGELQYYVLSRRRMQEGKPTSKEATSGRSKWRPTYHTGRQLRRMDLHYFLFIFCVSSEQANDGLWHFDDCSK